MFTFFIILLKTFFILDVPTILKQRLKEHNNKEELSTKRYVPFALIFYEAYHNQKDAKRREQYFKTTKGKTTLRTMLKEYFKGN